MKVYGLDLSNPTNKVRYVANYLKLDCEFEHVMPFSEQTQSDAYLKLHPAGKVPVIEDDGFTLFESNAIIKYLADKKKSSLYPQDLKQRAKVDQWMDFVSIHIRGAMARVFWNRIGVVFKNEKPDENSLKCGLAFLDRFLPIVEDQLGKGQYLIGDQFTLADFTLLAEIDGAEAGDFAAGKLGKIYAEYQARLRTLNAADFGDLLLHILTIFTKHDDVLAVGLDVAQDRSNDNAGGQPRIEDRITDQARRLQRFRLDDFAEVFADRMDRADAAAADILQDRRHRDGARTDHHVDAQWR